MIPTALSEQLRRGLRDFLRFSFSTTTPGLESALSEPDPLVRGPYVSLKLPFVHSDAPPPFPNVPLTFTPHAHQHQAFIRLKEGRSTLVATGTGSGKTESFLVPILARCLSESRPGIKAILVYPMNALATDQALRIAQLVHRTDALCGRVRAGLYIGESRSGRRAHQRTMAADSVITDRETLQDSPPDLLLTNYKMLDYLLIRPSDQRIWARNGPGDLRYLVVDELHTFDGAQGTDLACLIRRLKRRLAVADGSLCCVGTSATLGGDDAGASLLAYAEQVFGEPFSVDAVIGESRVTPAQFLDGHPIRFTQEPGAEHRDALDPTRHTDPLAWAHHQAHLWLGDDLPDRGSSDWAVEIGTRLQATAAFRALLDRIGTRTVALPDLVASLARARTAWRDDPALGELCVGSLLGLASVARTPRRDDPERLERFVDLRVQLWHRELARMVASVGDRPRLRHSDDLDQAARRAHLPLVHCRDCGAMGWATKVDPNQPHLLRVDLTSFYRAYFSGDARVRFLYPRAAVPQDDPEWRKQPVWRVDPHTLTVLPQEEAGDDLVELVPADSLRSSPDGPRLTRDCPFCAARESLTLVGFRAATLTSVFIDQLFASPFNDDKKLLAFSDSVQDAAHRAGFFGSRTWRTNLRIATLQVVRERPGLTLAELPAAVEDHWRGALDVPTYVATFLAPNMAWLHDWDDLKSTGELPLGSDLPRLVGRRLAYEIASELSLQARIGRSLPRIGAAVAVPDPERLTRAVDAALEPLRNEVPGLRELERAPLERLVRGFLRHLLERGGLLHPELPSRYVTSGGRDNFSFKLEKHLPSFGGASRMPALLVDRSGSTRFDHMGGGWYGRWVDRCLGTGRALGADAVSFYGGVLEVLVRVGLLQVREGDRGERIWGIRPDALRVVATTSWLRCDRCRLPLAVGLDELTAWVGMPCLSGHCRGVLAPDPRPAEDWFGRLYAHGDLQRISAEEHTGLLDRSVREEVERQFKATDPPPGADPADPQWRRPWYPNLLSCTPTLEMGIDIGDLSSAILCSMPPDPAAFLQRIGRAGRRDGNALVLTVANARPHDQYFYAVPEEMLEGRIEPPGVFLDTGAVLARQLTAYCFDRWVAALGADAVLPPVLRDVFAHLDATGDGHFPHNFTAFVGAQQPVLLREFLEMFGARLSASTVAHLTEFLTGAEGERAQLEWRLVDALQQERRSRDSLASKARSLREQIRNLRNAEAKPLDIEEQVDALDAEKEALLALVKTIDQRQTLEFLTDQGLLPNYAFPEAAVRLQSVIWRKKKVAPEKGSRYDTWTTEYARAPGTALSEFAPQADFYAGGRRVKIDQVDLTVSPVETWRFCDACNHAQRVEASVSLPTCPACGSVNWADDGQIVRMLRLQQVFASTSYKDSLIKDDRDEREPRFFQREMLVDIRDEDRRGAWQVTSPTLPFGFELLKRATFREVNFGEPNDVAAKSTLAGRAAARAGFRLCRRCGKVQDRGGDIEHALSCPLRKSPPRADLSAKRKESDGDITECLYLYREFSSEALRMLLPVADLAAKRPLHSFLAALQLGLKKKFRGGVDHLRATVTSEPEPGTALRRQYLVLYDTVPGGTGYLEQLVTPGKEGRLPLLEALELALEAMVGCSCWNDPDQDGCYKCLYAYRNSRDMDDTSADEAFHLLSRILDPRHRVEAIESVGKVSLAGLLDSALEARFLEALRRHVAPSGSAARLRHELIRGRKTGYRWSEGDAEWLVEPQVTEKVGGFEVSIDFVLRVATADESRQRTPIAVFLDGWEFHRDRAGWDLVQRQALQATGRYDLWTLTWTDLDRALGVGSPTPVLELALGEPKLWSKVLAVRGLSQYRDLPHEDLFDLFVSELCGTGRPWEGIGEALIMSRARPAAAGDADTWRQVVEARAPGPARSDLRGLVPKYVVFDEGSVSGFVRLVAAHDGSRPGLVATLDDAPSHREDPAFKSAWAGFLRLAQLLRAVPDTWFVARSVEDSDAWGTIALLRRGPDEPTGWGFDDELAEAFRPLASELDGAGVPAPEVGMDIPSDRGSTWTEGELVWEVHGVAVTDRARVGGARGRPAEGWVVFVLEDLDGPDAVIAALRKGNE